MFSYPSAKRDTTVDDFHGHQIPDPYRWLEESDTEETQQFIAAQNKLTEAFLSEISARSKILERLTALSDYEKWGPPIERQGTYFYFYNDGVSNQPSLYYTKESAFEDPPTLLLDPNQLSEDGTVAVNNIFPSGDGSHVAYTVSIHGSDKQRIYIRHVDTQQDLPEVLNFCKFATVAWLSDGSGFIYDRYPDPSSVPPEDENHFNSVYWHALNTPQSEDGLIYVNLDAKELGYRSKLSRDSDFLFLEVWHGAIARNQLLYRHNDSRETFLPIAAEADANYSVIGEEDGALYIQTDNTAPRGRVMRIDLSQPQRENWIEVIPEGNYVLDQVILTEENLIARVTRDVVNYIRIYDKDGQFKKELSLPAPGAISEMTGNQKSQTIFFSYQSHLQPPTIYQYEIKRDQLTPVFVPKVSFLGDLFHAEQHFYTSKDGTQVPMFIIHKKGIALDGSHPTLLYGYGGFSVSVPATFSSVTLQWVEMGGVFAIPNLRGGNEYGEEWHRAGMLENKQNVFDDFIAAAEWLIDKGYTTNSKLAINGHSNGGLLTAACMVQRPDLYGAILCGVPLIDMLRYHRFTVGHFWIPEYGDPENPEQFDFIRAYSPLHNVKEGVKYPPMLVYTAESDDRVVPMHALKYIATLQHADGGDSPLLLRLDTKSGHGLGKPIAKVLEEYADLHAFLFRILEMEG
ncbi:MAG: prolyl oligopeptidase family serine peptidase [Chloroflexota bacterium]